MITGLVNFVSTETGFSYVAIWAGDFTAKWDFFDVLLIDFQSRKNVATMLAINAVIFSFT